MRCRDCESHLMDGREELLGEGLKRDLEAHLERCPSCRSLKNDLELLRTSVPGLAAPPLSPALEERVRVLCHDEIEKLERRAAKPSGAPALPGFFWPVVGAIFVLTFVALIPGLIDFFRDGTWTYRTTLALVLVVQNVLTLLFAPVILVRRPENGAECG